MRLGSVLCLMLLPAGALGQEAGSAAPALSVGTPGSVPVVLPPPADPTVHRHLGFFLRLQIGVGYLGTSSAERSVSGVAVPLGFAIGGAVTENLIIAAEGWGIAAPKGLDSSIGLGGFGLNVTYYFMPANVYLSVTPSITAFGLTDGLNLFGSGGVTTDNSPGFGARVAVGKEWWVSDHWGLGLALELELASNKASAGSTTWTTFGGGIVFSATFN